VARLQEKEIRSGERIRRIVGILRLDGREVEVHLPYYIEIAKISATMQDTFILRLSNPLIQLEREILEYVFINFVFSGVELFGKCRFLEQARSFITLEYPESLKTRTKRRFQRVRMGEKITAELKYRETPEVKMERVTVKELPVKYSQLYWESQRENLDIKKIFLLGLREIRSICTNAEIVLYNKTTIHSRDARILRKSGKVLYVDFCSSTHSYTRLIPSDKLISYSYFLNEYKLRGASKEQIIAQLEEIIREDRSQHYSSKALIPLFSQDRVVGHVKVFQKEGAGRITLEDVNNLLALTKLIGLGIQKARYIPDLDDFIDSRLLNISEGGILLKIEDQRKEVSIPEGANVEVKFILGSKGFSLKGNICRKDEPRQFYAIKFIDVSSDEKKQIKGFVDETITKYHEMK
jgi:hypothetical protein